MVVCSIGVCGTGNFHFSRSAIKRFALICAVRERVRVSLPLSHMFRLRMRIISCKHSLQKAVLVGLSGGARFAIDLAIAHPEMVRKLVLVSPGMSGYEFVDAWTGQRAEEMKMAVMQRDLARAVEVFLVMWTDGPSRSPEQVDHAARERIGQMAAHSMELGAHTLKFR